MRDPVDEDGNFDRQKAIHQWLDREDDITKKVFVQNGFPLINVWHKKSKIIDIIEQLSKDKILESLELSEDELLEYDKSTTIEWKEYNNLPNSEHPIKKTYSVGSGYYQIKGGTCGAPRRVVAGTVFPRS